MPTSRSIRILGTALFLALCILAVGRVMVNAQANTESEVLELGARLYNENCAVCHGLDGQGRVGATLAKAWPSIKPDATIRTIIANGITGSVMYPWSQVNGGPLDESEIDALVVYILSWQTGGVPDLTSLPTATSRPPIAPVPEVEGDPNRGAVLFDENCAVCHGQNGEGRVGARLAKNWSSIRPDLTVRAIISQGVGQVMPSWSQAHGGPLTDDDIDDIVAFVLTLPPPAIDDTSAPAAPEPAGTSPISGAAGVLLGVVLFIVIVAIVLWAQRRK